MVPSSAYRDCNEHNDFWIFWQLGHDCSGAVLCYGRAVVTQRTAETLEGCGSLVARATLHHQARGMTWHVG